MASDCTIRMARPDDVPALHLLKWRGALDEGAAHTFRASEADWLRDMFGPRPRFAAIVAEMGSELIGMATLVERYYPAWVEPLFAIDDVFVTPERRRHGVGMALLARAAAEARRRGAPFVELLVRTQNPARRLYERAGFEHVRGAVTYVLAGDAFASLAQALQTLGNTAT
jgi:GNAT superfamily N-acetyltransferase